MKSQASIKNHPLHPMLILLPAGAFLIALIMDIVYIATGVPLWFEAVFPVLVIGLIGAAIAVIPGLIDLVAVVPKKNATKIGIAHMVTNIIMVAVFVGNAAIRFGAPLPDPGTLYGAFWLSLVGNILLVIGGYLGGKMVYTYRVGVLEEEDYAEVIKKERIERSEPRPSRPGSELESPA